MNRPLLPRQAANEYNSITESSSTMMSTSTMTITIRSKGSSEGGGLRSFLARDHSNSSNFSFPNASMRTMSTLSSCSVAERKGPSMSNTHNKKNSQDKLSCAKNRRSALEKRRLRREASMKTVEDNSHDYNREGDDDNSIHSKSSLSGSFSEPFKSPMVNRRSALATFKSTNGLPIKSPKRPILDRQHSISRWEACSPRGSNAVKRPLITTNPLEVESRWEACLSPSQDSALATQSSTRDLLLFRLNRHDPMRSLGSPCTKVETPKSDAGILSPGAADPGRRLLMAQSRAGSRRHLFQTVKDVSARCLNKPVRQASSESMQLIQDALIALSEDPPSIPFAKSINEKSVSSSSSPQSIFDLQDDIETDDYSEDDMPEHTSKNKDNDDEDSADRERERRRSFTLTDDPPLLSTGSSRWDASLSTPISYTTDGDDNAGGSSSLIMDGFMQIEENYAHSQRQLLNHKDEPMSPPPPPFSPSVISKGTITSLTDTSIALNPVDDQFRVLRGEVEEYFEDLNEGISSSRKKRGNGEDSNFEPSSDEKSIAGTATSLDSHLHDSIISCENISLVSLDSIRTDEIRSISSIIPRNRCRQKRSNSDVTIDIDQEEIHDHKERTCFDQRDHSASPPPLPQRQPSSDRSKFQRKLMIHRTASKEREKKISTNLPPPPPSPPMQEPNALERKDVKESSGGTPPPPPPPPMQEPNALERKDVTESSGGTPPPPPPMQEPNALERKDVKESSGGTPPLPPPPPPLPPSPPSGTDGFRSGDDGNRRRLFTSQQSFINRTRSKTPRTSPALSNNRKTLASRNNNNNSPNQPSEGTTTGLPPNAPVLVGVNLPSQKTPQIVNKKKHSGQFH